MSDHRGKPSPGFPDFRKQPLAARAKSGGEYTSAAAAATDSNKAEEIIDLEEEKRREVDEELRDMKLAAYKNTARVKAQIANNNVNENLCQQQIDDHQEKYARKMAAAVESNNNVRKSKVSTTTSDDKSVKAKLELANPFAQGVESRVGNIETNNSTSPRLRSERKKKVSGSGSYTESSEFEKSKAVLEMDVSFANANKKRQANDNSSTTTSSSYPGAVSVRGPGTSIENSSISTAGRSLENFSLSTERASGSYENNLENGPTNDYVAKGVLAEEDNEDDSSNNKSVLIGEAVPEKKYALRAGIIIFIAIAIAIAVATPITINSLKPPPTQSPTTSPSPTVQPMPSEMPSIMPSSSKRPSLSIIPTNTPSFRPSITPQWIQLIDGNEKTISFFETVSLSASGLRLAVGLPHWNDDHGFISVGKVEVWDYNFNDGSLLKVGPPILGDNIEQSFGTAVALSGDGTRLAVLSHGKSIPTVCVYSFQKEDNEWVQVGQVLENLGHGCHNKCMSLSDDGEILIVGSPYNQTVQVFEFDNAENSNTQNTISLKNWTLKGNMLAGKFDNDRFGLSVDSAPDGNTFIVGSPGTSKIGGYAQIFTFNDGEWESKGDIPTTIGNLEGWDVAISSDGNTVAVSAILYDGVGRVQIYRYNSRNLDWLSFGNSIIGDVEFDNFGWDISLSSDGNTIVIGSGGNNTSITRAFQYNGDKNGYWKQFGSDLYNSGYAVECNLDCSIVAIGYKGLETNHTGYVSLLKEPIL